MRDFEEFYTATRHRLLRVLVAVTGDVQDAQDCVQEAYVRAAVRWRTVSATDSPEAWVRRVAMNLAYDGHRRRSVRSRFVRSSRPPDPVAAPQDHVLDVVRAVRRLPRAQQEVVVLHHVLDLPVEDVARELGRSTSTVKSQLVRGRARLAELLSLDDEVRST